MKIAVITPYYREPIDVLRACRASVAAQTVACQHYLVADGYPQAWVDAESPKRVVHLKLPRPHGDYGNTPRGLGALLAMSDGADVIAFLDADNTYDADHIEHCLDVYGSNRNADFIAARRRIVLPGGTPTPNEPAEASGEHVDTSQYVLVNGSLHAAGNWLMQPKQLSLVGDALFLAQMRTAGLRPVHCKKPTVTYTSTWAAHYRAAGVAPPPNAKPSIDARPILRWISELTPAERAALKRRMGGDALGHLGRSLAAQGA